MWEWVKIKLVLVFVYRRAISAGKKNVYYQNYIFERRSNKNGVTCIPFIHYAEHIIICGSIKTLFVKNN